MIDGAFQQAAVVVAQRSGRISKHQRDAIRVLEQLCDEVMCKGLDTHPDGEGFCRLRFWIAFPRGAQDVVVDRDGRILI